MEQKVNAWKANLNSGLILALVGIAWSLIMYFLDLYLNKTQGYVFMLVQIGLLYYLLKSYRDNFLFGNISYGQSVGAGVIICLYYTVAVAIFTYILYSYIDPGLIKKQLAIAEEAMVKRGTPQAGIDAGMAFTEKIMKPGIMVITTLFVGMLYGTVLTLLVSIFVKKEGNPLVDTPEN
jgi:hypothetical protein